MCTYKFSASVKVDKRRMNKKLEHLAIFICVLENTIANFI